MLGWGYIKMKFSSLKCSVLNVKKRPKSWGQFWGQNPLKDKDVVTCSEQFCFHSTSILSCALYSALVSKINLPSCELFVYNFKFSIATVQITLRLQLKKHFVLSCECGSLVDWPSLSCFWAVMSSGLWLAGMFKVASPRGCQLILPVGLWVCVVWAPPSMGARFQEGVSQVQVFPEGGSRSCSLLKG